MRVPPDEILGSYFSGTHADQIADKQYDRDQIKNDGDACLAEILSTIREHQCNENQFADTGNCQNQWPTRRVVCTLDQHRAHERNQRAPVTHDDF